MELMSESTTKHAIFYACDIEAQIITTQVSLSILAVAHLVVLLGFILERLQ